jgi:hypothetical protein
MTFAFSQSTLDKTSFTRKRELGMTDPNMAGNFMKLRAKRNRREQVIAMDLLGCCHSLIRCMPCSEVATASPEIRR